MGSDSRPLTSHNISSFKGKKCHSLQPPVVWVALTKLSAHFFEFLHTLWMKCQFNSRVARCVSLVEWQFSISFIQNYFFVRRMTVLFLYIMSRLVFMNTVVSSVSCSRAPQQDFLALHLGSYTLRCQRVHISSCILVIFSPLVFLFLSPALVIDRRCRRTLMFSVRYWPNYHHRCEVKASRRGNKGWKAFFF